VQHGHETSVVLGAGSRRRRGYEALAAQAFERCASAQVPAGPAAAARAGSDRCADAAVDALADVSPLGKRNLVAAPKPPAPTGGCRRTKPMLRARGPARLPCRS
jgi:hypothetical protein